MVSERLSNYCRREWSQTSDCEGLCVLCLEWKRLGWHLGDLPGVIASYLISHELVVWTRQPGIVDLCAGEKQRCHLQVVDFPKNVNVVDIILDTPRQASPRMAMDRIAISADLKYYALLWHDVEHWEQSTQLEVFHFESTLPQSLHCRTFNGGDEPEMPACALKFSTTDVTLLACSAGGETRLYQIVPSSGRMNLLWSRKNTWADNLGFWGSTGHVVIAPYGTCWEQHEICTINFETQKMSRLFELLSPDAFGRGSCEISAFAISPDSDAFALTLGSLYLLKFHTAMDTKFPVAEHDCDFSIKLAINHASIRAMDWIKGGIILGDNFGRCYIIRDACRLVFNQDCSFDVSPYLPAVYPENTRSFQPVCEVFTWNPVKVC